MNQIDPSAVFEAAVVSRGHQISRQGDSMVVGNGSESLRLRMIHAGVILEITHGPEDESAIFWHELYSDQTDTDELPLQECIEYGLDLMFPYDDTQQNKPNPKAGDGDAEKAV